MFGVEALMKSVDICFRAIQGKETLIVEQNNRFAKICADVEGLFSLRRRNDVDVLSETALGTHLYSASGVMATTEGMSHFFENCGTFATSCLR